MLMKNPASVGNPVTRAIRSVVGLAVVVAAIAGAVVVGWRLFDRPFATTQVDRSTPPVLLELRDLAEFHAAQGQYEVTVDVEQDVNWVPSWLAGERVQFVAVGTVDAIVDFRRINESSFRVDEATNSVVVTLEPVRLSDPVIDLDISHVMNRDRGLLDRLGGVFTDSPTTEAWLYGLAEDKIARAAEATELADRARTNATVTLTAMLQALGFERVEVRFQMWPTAPTSAGADTPVGGDDPVQGMIVAD